MSTPDRSAEGKPTNRMIVEQTPGGSVRVEFVPIDRVPPNERAPWLLKAVIEHGDENGDLANATADELRDALALAAERIREMVRRWPVMGALISRRAGKGGI